MNQNLKKIIIFFNLLFFVITTNSSYSYIPKPALNTPKNVSLIMLKSFFKIQDLDKIKDYLSDPLLIEKIGRAKSLDEIQREVEIYLKNIKEAQNLLTRLKDDLEILKQLQLWGKITNEKYLEYQRELDEYSRNFNIKGEIYLVSILRKLENYDKRITNIIQNPVVASRTLTLQITSPSHRNDVAPKTPAPKTPSTKHSRALSGGFDLEEGESEKKGKKTSPENEKRSRRQSTVIINGQDFSNTSAVETILVEAISSQDTKKYLQITWNFASLSWVIATVKSGMIFGTDIRENIATRAFLGVFMGLLSVDVLKLIGEDLKHFIENFKKHNGSQEITSEDFKKIKRIAKKDYFGMLIHNLLMEIVWAHPDIFGEYSSFGDIILIYAMLYEFINFFKLTYDMFAMIQKYRSQIVEQQEDEDATIANLITKIEQRDVEDNVLMTIWNQFTFAWVIHTVHGEIFPDITLSEPTRWILVMFMAGLFGGIVYYSIEDCKKFYRYFFVNKPQTPKLKNNINDTHDKLTEILEGKSHSLLIANITMELIWAMKDVFFQEEDSSFNWVIYAFAGGYLIINIGYFVKTVRKSMNTYSFILRRGYNYIASCFQAPAELTEIVIKVTKDSPPPIELIVKRDTAISLLPNGKFKIKDKESFNPLLGGIIRKLFPNKVWASKLDYKEDLDFIWDPINTTKSLGWISPSDWWYWYYFTKDESILQKIFYLIKENLRQKGFDSSDFAILDARKLIKINRAV
jgi:hypothetical protein